MVINKDSTLEKIKKTTGKGVTVCGCTKCQGMCSNPCIGTPYDMEKIVNAGFSNGLSPTLWAVGMLYGISKEPIAILAPTYDKQKKSCTFFTEGKCELHDLGLKPTEGRLATHEAETFSSIEEFKKLSIAWNVAKEWM